MGTRRVSQGSSYFYCTILAQEAKHMLSINYIFKFGPNGDLFSKWLPIFGICLLLLSPVSNIDANIFLFIFMGILMGN